MAAIPEPNPSFVEQIGAVDRSNSSGHTIAKCHTSSDREMLRAVSVALVTCEELPEPDPDHAPLSDALAAAGIAAELCVWTDDTIDWAAYRVALLRSTWDYFENRDRFLGWAERVSAVCQLWNPLAVVRWNTHKGYLLELSRRGLPVVPTHLVGPADASLASICDTRGWTDIVIKPVVSAASFQTHRMRRDALDEPLFARLRRRREMMVQPFVDSVTRYGERAVVVIDGEVTHSVRKQPRLSGQDERVSGPHPVAEQERSLALSAIAAVGEPILYGRVDMAPDAAGAPMIMELELTEPSLFFPQCPAALERFVAALHARFAQSIAPGLRKSSKPPS